MSATGYCRGRFSLSSFILIVVLSVLGYIIYSESTTGGYSQWSSWSECSKSCGEGLHGRSRKCIAPKPGLIGKYCQGPASMVEKCFIHEHCPIDGGFSDWSNYSVCDKTCAGGKRTRTRRCTNPVPEHGGKECQGKYMETTDCNVQPCPINGKYSAWKGYGKCEITGDKSCGKGKHVRTRTCNNPVPQHGGKACEGPDSETAECVVPCPTSPPLKTTVSLNTTLSSNTTSKVVPTTVKPS